MEETRKGLKGEGTVRKKKERTEGRRKGEKEEGQERREKGRK